MERFTTADGKQYILKLTLGAVIAVEEELKINLLNPHIPDADDALPLGYELATNDAKLARVVSVVIGDQLKNNNVDPREFFESIDGATMKAINEAFFAELKLFFADRQIPTISEYLRDMTDTVEASIRERAGETC